MGGSVGAFNQNWLHSKKKNDGIIINIVTADAVLYFSVTRYTVF